MVLQVRQKDQEFQGRSWREGSAVKITGCSSRAEDWGLIPTKDKTAQSCQYSSPRASEGTKYVWYTNIQTSQPQDFSL